MSGIRLWGGGLLPLGDLPLLEGSPLDLDLKKRTAHGGTPLGPCEEEEGRACKNAISGRPHYFWKEPAPLAIVDRNSAGLRAAGSMCTRTSRTFGNLSLTLSLTM